MSSTHLLPCNKEVRTTSCVLTSWRLSPSPTSPGIVQTTVEELAVNWCHKSVEGRLAIGYRGQFHFSGRPTIRLPGFDLHRRQRSLLNRFRTGQGHCNACHKKWGFTNSELCDYGEIQTMSHVVNSCPLTKFDGGLLRLHEADEAAVDWLTTYGS